MRSNQLRRLALPAVLAACAPLGWAAGDDYPSEAASLFARVLEAGECAPTAEHECNVECERAYEASQKLGGLLTGSPETFEAVAPLFREAFEQGGAAREKLLRFLASCGSSGCTALGDELFAAAPQDFTEAQMLALAEVGSEPMREALLARVKARRAESVLPAAWLAFRGEAAGKSALKQVAATREVDADNVVAVLVSAGALAALGDERALPAARERVHAAVLAALDAGELESARAMALSAELLQSPLEQAVRAAAYGASQKAVRVSTLETKVGWHCKQRSAELADADQVFELIERITPLS